MGTFSGKSHKKTPFSTTWEGQSGSFEGVCASIWCPMGGSWLQSRVRYPRRAAQQAGATQGGRRGRPIYCLLLFMPLMGGTIRVFLRSVRGSVSVDLVLTNGKRMVKALPMALPGASQGCRTLGYDRGGDKAPQTRSNGCREIVFGHDAPLWSEPFNRSRTVMAAVRVAHPPAPRRHPRELSYHPQHP